MPPPHPLLGDVGRRAVPDTARVLMDGVEVEIDVDAVIVGDLVVVRPGAPVPLDGIVTTGHAAIVGRSPTGRWMPLERGVGDAVAAGAVVVGSDLVVRITADGAASRSR